MRRSPDDDLSPDVQALLDSGRPVVPVSSTTRARAMARARATLAAPLPSRDEAIGHRTFAHPNWWAAAASIALLAAVMGGAAAYELRVHLASPAARSSPSVPAANRVPKPSEVIVLPVDLPVDAPRVEAPTSGPLPVSRAALAREELQLLQHARAAMARRDLAAALVPLAEHARRFKDGRLAEEREALRVKALSGLGRTREARRILGAFEARFPRSPLLPALSHLVESAR